MRGITGKKFRNVNFEWKVNTDFFFSYLNITEDEIKLSCKYYNVNFFWY